MTPRIREDDHARGGRPTRREPLATALALFLIAAALTAFGFCAWFLNLPEGGVRLPN